jgi:hypothetical protein
MLNPGRRSLGHITRRPLIGCARCSQTLSTCSRDEHPQPAAIFRPLVLCMPTAMPIQLPLRHAHPAAFPPLVRNLTSRRPTSPTIDTRASQLLASTPYPTCAHTLTHTTPMGSLLRPFNHAPCRRFRKEAE